jgi:hypothetical protein
VRRLDGALAAAARRRFLRKNSIEVQDSDVETGQSAARPVYSKEL